MAQPKRKRQNDEDNETRAAAQAEKTRRVTRQTSIPPPLLPQKETKEALVPQRRTLRGSSSAAADVDMSTDLATARRSQGRTRHASKLSSDDVDNVAVDGHDDEHKGENEQRAEKARTTRSKAKAREEEEVEEEKEEEPKSGLQRRLRGGKTIAESEPASKPRPAKTATDTSTRTSTKRRTRQAAKGIEIADSDDDSKSVPDSEEQSGGQSEDRSEEDSSEATPPHTRRTRKADLHTSEPIVPPLTPPHAPAPGITRSAIPPPVIPASAASTATADAAAASASQPRKETMIKPPSVPTAPASAAAAPAVLPAAARPKKVTEIKPPAAPPAPRFPPKTTPIQPPILAAFASATSRAPAQVHNPTPAQKAKPTPHQPTANAPRSQQQQFSKTTTVTPITAPRPLTVAAAKPTAASTSTSTSPTTATSTTAPAATASKTTAPPASPSQPDRNIDKVVLGEICFKAWYPSYYGKEVLGDSTGNTHHGRGGHASKGQPGKENHVSGHHHYHHHHHHHAGHKDKEHTPILDRLYVCPFCFKYSREIVPWHGHVQVCESQFQIPGEKVYVHPRGVRTIRVPIAPNTPGARGNKRRKSGAGSSTGNGSGSVTGTGTGTAGGGGGSNAAGGSPTRSSAGGSASAAADHEYIEQVVKDEGEWSIWEVDGERDVLFCQNISLFAKLFLDTKSVFFDVTGFKYFLLVYTPPPSLPSSLRAAATATLSSMSGGAGGSGNGNGAGQPPASILGGAAPRPRVVGFFSKEKMSWDNNNLACILVFPPWQRKGLGALLMGISYEISRREGVLGGPEKPISDLGKKGYKRFWAGEIARWLLSVDISAALSASRSGGTESSLSLSAPSALSSVSSKPAAAAASSVDELVIDIDDCSKATWIVRDDCLYVLREMGIVEDAGLGPAKRFCENVLPRADVASAEGVAGTDQAADAAATTGASSSAAADTTATVASAPATTGASAASAATADTEAPPEVKRVRLSKAAVRQWVRDNRISLDRTCDPAGFIKDYSPKEAQATEEV